MAERAQLAATLRAEGYSVGEKRICASLRRLQPEEVAARRNWRQHTCGSPRVCVSRIHAPFSIRRGPQKYRYFNDCWCVDANLKMFVVLGLYLFAAVDGTQRQRLDLSSRAACAAFTKMPIYLTVGTDKLAVTVLPSYLAAAAVYGCPDRLISDHGAESALLLYANHVAMLAWQKATGRASERTAFHLTQSVHNQPVETFWREPNNRITALVKARLFPPSEPAADSAPAVP